MPKGRIMVNPDIRFGKPCIKGTRIAVSDILNLISAGYAISDEVRSFGKDIPSQYPGITYEDVIAAIEYASQFMEQPVQVISQT